MYGSNGWRLLSCTKVCQSAESTVSRFSPWIKKARTVANYRHAETHCALACVGKLDSTGTSLMIEPLPLAVADSASGRRLPHGSTINRTFLDVMDFSR
jgi:hypothetical protein